MPFIEHQDFELPEDRKQSIWRYMDLAKFLSLVDSRSLFFTSIKKLCEQDPYEGSYTSVYKSLGSFEWTTAPDSVTRALGIESELMWKHFQHQTQVLQTHARKLHGTVCVNCWHLQEHESAAMWSQYARDHQGIAVVSTVGRLIDSVAAHSEHIMIGKVKYLDYNRDFVNIHNMFNPFMAKRRSFDHEHELRALMCPDLDMKSGPYPDHGNGVAVPIDLNALIETILVGPTAPQWVISLVESIMRKYDLDKPVWQSSLLTAP